MRRLIACGVCVLVALNRPRRLPATRVAGNACLRPDRRTVSRGDPGPRPGHARPSERLETGRSGPYLDCGGDYLADADGRIDVDVAPSLGGSYEGVSPHGLWCSALPVEPERLSAYLDELPKHPELGTAPHLPM